MQTPKTEKFPFVRWSGAYAFPKTMVENGMVHFLFPSQIWPNPNLRAIPSSTVMVRFHSSGRRVLAWKLLLHRGDLSRWGFLRPELRLLLAATRLLLLLSSCSKALIPPFFRLQGFDCSRGFNVLTALGAPRLRLLRSFRLLQGFSCSNLFLAWTFPIYEVLCCLFFRSGVVVKILCISFFHIWCCFTAYSSCFRSGVLINVFPTLFCSLLVQFS